MGQKSCARFCSFSVTFTQLLSPTIWLSAMQSITLNKKDPIIKSSDVYDGHKHIYNSQEEENWRRSEREQDVPVQTALQGETFSEGVTLIEYSTQRLPFCLTFFLLYLCLSLSAVVEASTLAVQQACKRPPLEIWPGAGGIFLII